MYYGGNMENKIKQIIFEEFSTVINNIEDDLQDNNIKKIITSY